MNATFTNLTAAVVAVLIALGTIVPVVTVPATDHAVATVPEFV